jgi:hypothetical protein
MPEISIVDATGKGYGAMVNSSHQLLANARAVSAEHWANEEEGAAFQVTFEQSPTAADDAIFYLENSNGRAIIVEGVTISVDGACDVYFQINDKGSRNAAVTLTPVNLNSQSGLLLDGIAEQGADLDGGGVTLTGGAEFDRLRFAAARDSFHYNFPADLVLKAGGTMTIWCSSAAVTVLATIVTYLGLAND